jgi:hypothetical protein
VETRVQIPYGMKYTVLTCGSMLKAVHCEQCGRDFLYDLYRRAEGTGHSLLFLDNAGAQERAATNAELELARKLERGIDPVPCPFCGLYQSDMIPIIRHRYRGWMRVLGACLILLQFPIGVAFVIIGLRQDWGIEIPWPIVGVLAGLLAVSGFSLLIARFRQAARIDPNGTDVEERKRIGESRACDPEDPTRLLSERIKREEKETVQEAISQWSNERLIRLLYAGLGFAFFCIAIWLIFRLSPELTDGAASTKWPKVMGSMKSATMTRESGKDPNSARYGILVQYAYVVDGRDYNGTRVRFTPINITDEVEAQQRLSMYVPPKSVDVYFRPGDPGNSVLEPGIPSHRYAVAIGAIIVGLASLIFAGYQIRRFFLGSDPIQSSNTTSEVSIL